MHELMKFTSTVAFLRFSLLFLVLPREASLLPFVCWCVSYGGNNVGALSKSTRAKEREREKERKEGREAGRDGEGRERKRALAG